MSMRLLARHCILCISVHVACIRKQRAQLTLASHWLDGISNIEALMSSCFLKAPKPSFFRSLGDDTQFLLIHSSVDISIPFPTFLSPLLLSNVSSRMILLHN